MTRKSVSEKNEKSLAEVILTVLMVLLLMSIFIYYFFKDDSQITKAGYSALASSFFAQVSSIRAQWYMENQPEVVAITVMNDGSSENEVKKYIPVNKYGWVDISARYDVENESTTACQKIWHYLMDIPMSFMRQPISAVEIKKKGTRTGRICRYSIESGDFFEYHSDKGKVLTE